MVLASFSYGRYASEHHVITKPVALWRTHEAAMIADLWNVSPGELATADNIYAENLHHSRKD